MVLLLHIIYVLFVRGEELRNGRINWGGEKEKRRINEFKNRKMGYLTASSCFLLMDLYGRRMRLYQSCL